MKNKYIFVGVLLVVLAVSSYLVSVMGNKIKTPQDEFLVVTSFYPVQIAALNVVDDIEGVQVECLTRSTTGCVHDIQLTTQDMRLLEQADLFLINGAGMESYLDSIIERYPDLKIVDTSQNTEILEAEEGHNHSHEESDHIEDHMEESIEEHPEEIQGEDEHNHENCVMNAHIWMDMDNYCVQIENIGKAFMELDTDNASQYEKNVDIYRQKVEKLQEKAAALSAGKPHIHVISTHEAFSYFAENMGWHIEKTVNMDENTSLHAAQVGEIIDIVQKEQIPYVLTEEIYGMEISSVLEAETDSETVRLDTLVTGEMNKDAYLEGMNRNLVCLEEVIGHEAIP